MSESLFPDLKRDLGRPKEIPEGDPAVVRSSGSRAESQARLNGPSGSPTSPSGPVRLTNCRKRLSKGESYFVALDLLAIAEAASAFIATTSIYRQPKASRDEFEALVVAIVKAETQLCASDQDG